MARILLDKIKIGDYANDGTGDDLRTAFARVNLNFKKLENDITSIIEDTSPKLGGDLDLNGFKLKSNTPIRIQSEQVIATGNIVALGNMVAQTVTANQFIGKISDISDHKLDELQDVTILETLEAGQTIIWSGEQWISGNADAKVSGVDGGSAATIYNLDDGIVIDGGYAD